MITCNICSASYHPKRGHCPICGSFYVKNMGNFILNEYDKILPIECAKGVYRLAVQYTSDDFRDAGVSN